MIWEMRREEEGLLTAVGDRESWKEKEKAGNQQNSHSDFVYVLSAQTEGVTTRSVVSSASGEWHELMLFLGVLLGLG